VIPEEQNWVANVIAGLALAVSGLALYLQRRDSRPRLSVAAASGKIAPSIYDPTTDRTSRLPVEWAQTFKIRNVGNRQVRIQSVQARWLWTRPRPVEADWQRTPLLEPDTACECTLYTSKVIAEPLSGMRKAFPFFRVEFLDQVGRSWSAGFRRLPH